MRDFYTQFTHIRHFTCQTRAYIPSIGLICRVQAVEYCDECDVYHYHVSDSDGQWYRVDGDDMMTVQ